MNQEKWNNLMPKNKVNRNSQLEKSQKTDEETIYKKTAIAKQMNGNTSQIK